MTAAHDRLDDRYLSMVKEARRLPIDNSANDQFALKALTLRQPWAASVFIAGKDFENRFWPARVRGTIAIHVSKDQPKTTFDGGVRFVHALLRKQGKTNIRFDSLDKLPRGAIIGVVDLVDCVSQSDSPWFEGPLGFKLSNPRLLQKPIPTSGKRRFWKVSKGVETRIRRDLGEQGLTI
ncbi:MAG: ASCH domain-containing protein [Candidatus Obscuribacterales bacterium]|nr:ASCH domain-containing protein [Candidatus Obscuribacterales bacterium]